MVSAKRPILIMAGGTGGHVFPALAVAQALREQGETVRWLGTRRGMEAQLIPRYDIEIDFISVTGLRGKGVLGWTLAPLRLSYALLQSLRVCYRARPRAVLGMGGFVTGPGGIASWLLRKPLLVHEQNAIAGMTNRWLARFANQVLQAFPDTFSPRRNLFTTGNPLRSSISAIEHPEQRFARRRGPLRILIIGGSLGALALNQTVPRALAELAQDHDLSIWHQAGRGKDEQTVAIYDALQLQAKVEAFVDSMDEAYAWADLIICRAGAMTVSEISAVGLASILVPFPHAVDDHQTANARYLADADAAVLLQQVQMSEQRLVSVLSDLLAGGRERLLAMAKRARDLGKPRATDEVVAHCLEVARG